MKNVIFFKFDCDKLKIIKIDNYVIFQKDNQHYYSNYGTNDDQIRDCAKYFKFKQLALVLIVTNDKNFQTQNHINLIDSDSFDNFKQIIYYRFNFCLKSF